MTAGFLSVPIMMPNHCWTVLHVSIIAALLLTINADGEDSKCEDEVIVNHNTVYKAFLGKELRINCTVEFCSDPPPTVFWYKSENKTVPVNVSSSSHIRTEWRDSNRFEGISYLIFQNILMSDSGLYQCQSGESVSHNINVVVSESGYDEQTSRPTVSNPQTSSASLDPKPKENPWLYIYTAAGILTFVILVIIISVASMRGCKGRSKTETQTDNQYMPIPLVEQPFQHASLQASPRGSPSAPPSRRSTRRNRSPSKPVEMPLQRDNGQLDCQIKDNRERQRNTREDEGGSVVYAALNHQVPAAAAARPRQLQEECSEYAVIRIKEV